MATIESMRQAGIEADVEEKRFQKELTQALERFHKLSIEERLDYMLELLLRHKRTIRDLIH